MSKTPIGPATPVIKDRRTYFTNVHDFELLVGKKKLNITTFICDYCEKSILWSEVKLFKNCDACSDLIFDHCKNCWLQHKIEPLRRKCAKIKKKLDKNNGEENEIIQHIGQIIDDFEKLNKNNFEENESMRYLKQIADGYEKLILIFEEKNKK